jgi:UDP-glucose 4-epimerase
VSLRYFNAAGATLERGEDHREETHIIPILFQVAHGQRERFQVYGDDYPTSDGTCIRDSVHLLDIAEAHILSFDQLDRVSGQAFNVGNNRGYSVREVLESARQISGKPIPATVGPWRAGDPTVLVASSEEIRRELGWQTHLSDLKSMVEMAWAWKLRFPSGYRGTPQSFNHAK